MGYRNKEDAAAYQKRYWILNKAVKRIKLRGYYLKYKHNLTAEEYEELLVGQDFKCALCKKHMSEFKQKLAVDHCHTTGTIRGLLCMKCNTSLGQLGDTIGSISNVLKYLQTQNASV